MKKIIIMLCVITSSFLWANEMGKKSEIQEEKNEESQQYETYKIMADIDFSAYSGAENILFLHESLEKTFSYIFKNVSNNRAISSVLRILELGLIYSPLARAEIVVQHEVFGHGYRIRDIGSDRAKVKKYRIDLPPPYSDGGGATIYGFNSDLTSFQEIAISSAGVEATAILANRLKMKWMESLRVDSKKASLYLQSHFDIVNYILSMEDSIWFADTGHDIKSYIFWLNNTYYNDELTVGDLKNSVLINFLDPMTYYSIGSILYYVFTGKDIKIPMIGIKDIKFLPNFRLGLAPYGTEFFLENFFSYKKRAIYSYLRAGNHNNNTYFGFGLECSKLYQFNLNSIGFRADVFYQPKIYSKEAMTVFENIQLGYTIQELDTMIYGTNFNIIYDRKFSKNSNSSFFAQVGYKTDGFIPGFSLKKAVVVRLGIGHCFF